MMHRKIVGALPKRFMMMDILIHLQNCAAMPKEMFIYVDLKAYLYPVNEKSIIEQKEDNIELYVENNGNTTVDKVKVSLSDTLGNVVNKTVDITLLPGCGEVIKLTYAPKSGYTNTFLTVTVNAVSSVKEKTPDDNTLKEEIGLCDLLVEEISVDSVGDNYFLSAIISNNSFVSAEKVTVDTYFDSLETSAAKSRTVDSVACGENIFINIPVCKSNLSFDENGAAKVYVVVSSKSKENMTEDNTLCFIIRDDENKCGHPIKKLISTVESTCEKEGYNVYLCEACGKEITETIPIIDHDFSEWITEIEPTCTEMGIKYRVCSACGARETSNISANGHEYSDEWTIDKEATCITEGSKSHHCIHCDSKTDVTVIEKAEHQYGDWIVVKEATCNSEGTRSKVCSICNNVIKATIPKTQHNYVVSVVAPSCTENGYTIHTCSICGYSFTDGEVPAHHTDEDNDGICDICGTDLSPHDPATHCSCNCHKSGIVKFFWKIANFFRKIFKMEKYHYCDCGAAHW